MNLEKLHQLGDVQILVYGDYMVDEYIDGAVERISPESPVPVLSITKRSSNLGGAGNVINNIVRLGGSVKAVGFVGRDDKGSWILKELDRLNVNREYLFQKDEISTIVKTRIRSRNQQFIRIDNEKIEDIPHQLADELLENIDYLIKGVNAVVISDYGKGAVTKGMAQAFISSAKNHGIPIIVDPKGMDYQKYQDATICTPNTLELKKVMQFDDLSEESISKNGKLLQTQLALDYLILTRSEKGISAFPSDTDEKWDYPVIKKDVVDVTGAGDTVVSILALSYTLGFSIEDCCNLANHAASIVCSKAGSATVTVNELVASIHQSGEFKQLDIENLSTTLEYLREQGKRIVFTNGCFDLLHAGHLSSFNQAKAMGDVLIVGVNSDASIKRIKGENRPIIDEDNRIAMLSALECIDYVVKMEEDNPVRLIEIIQPDIAVKGEDWRNKVIPEKEIIESYGGEMKFIKLSDGLSTTAIIEKIRTI